jgi:hypothetical protein
MNGSVYRYTFNDDVSLTEVQATLVLTIMAIESLHGDAQVRLDARHFLDEAQRKCVIDTTSAVGQDFNVLFAGFLLREFGPDSFQVERVQKESAFPKSFSPSNWN